MKKSVFLILSLFILGACAEEKIEAPPPDCDESYTSSVRFQNGRISQIETDNTLETFSYAGNTVIYTRYVNDTSLRSKHYYYLQNGLAKTSIDTQYLATGDRAITHHHYTHISGQLTYKVSYGLFNDGADTVSSSDSQYNYDSNGNLKRISSNRPGVFDGSSYIEFNYGSLMNRGSVITEYYNPVIGIKSPNHPSTAKVKEAFKQEIPVEYTYELYSDQALKSVTEYRDEPNGEKWICRNYQY